MPVPEIDGASCQEELPSSKLESEIIVLGLGASENIQVIYTGGNGFMSFSTGVLNPANKDPKPVGKGHRQLNEFRLRAHQCDEVYG